jgi:hypothetical protein
MENKLEDEITKRWEQEAKEKAEHEYVMPKKRVRALEYGAFTPNDVFNASGSTSGSGKAKAKAAQKPGRAAGARARGKIAEMVEEGDDTVVELD